MQGRLAVGLESLRVGLGFLAVELGFLAVGLGPLAVGLERRAVKLLVSSCIVSIVTLNEGSRVFFFDKRDN